MPLSLRKASLARAAKLPRQRKSVIGTALSRGIKEISGEQYSAFFILQPATTFNVLATERPSKHYRCYGADSISFCNTINSKEQFQNTVQDHHVLGYRCTLIHFLCSFQPRKGNVLTMLFLTIAQGTLNHFTNVVLTKTVQKAGNVVKSIVTENVLGQYKV